MTKDHQLRPKNHSKQFTFQDLPQPARAHLNGLSEGSSSPCLSLACSCNSPEVLKQFVLTCLLAGQQDGRPQAYGLIAGLCVDSMSILTRFKFENDLLGCERERRREGVSSSLILDDFCRGRWTRSLDVTSLAANQAQTCASLSRD